MENKEMVKVVDLLPERHPPALEILNYEIAIFL